MRRSDRSENLRNKNGIPETGLYCAATENTFFDVYPISQSYNQDEGVILQFSQFAGRIAITKTTARLNGINWKLRPYTSPARRFDGTVWEKDVNLKVSAPLEGDQFKGFSLEVLYATGFPVQLKFYKEGKEVSEVLTLNNCYYSN